MVYHGPIKGFADTPLFLPKDTLNADIFAVADQKELNFDQF